MQHRSDRMLSSVPPASGVKMALRPVKQRRRCQDRPNSVVRSIMRHQMCPVATSGVLDLFVVDRTPGGSVWSLPPVCLVS